MSEETKKPLDKDVEDNRVLAAIGYIWILCLLPLFLKRDSKFAQFHAKQGLVLFIIELLGSLVFWFPVFGWLLALLVLGTAVYGAYKALNGEWYKMPYVYDLSKKINI